MNGSQDQLLQHDYAVYPINAVAAKSYLRRKAPSGVKTDHLDAWSLADAACLGVRDWRARSPTDELSLQLRLLCQDEVVLISQHTQLVNQV